MYIKAAILALVAPLACATIQLQQPATINSDSPVTINWSSTDPGNDPTSFSLELVNPVNFHNSYAVATNVQTSLGTITITLPSVPKGDGYSLEAINISNINDVYSKVGPFSVGAAVVSVTTSNAKGSGTAVSATTFPTQVTTSSAFGTTVGSSATSFAPSGSSTVTFSSSVSGSKASSASGSSPSSLSGGAMAHSSSFVTLALSAFAGVTLLAL